MVKKLKESDIDKLFEGIDTDELLSLDEVMEFISKPLKELDYEELESNNPTNKVRKIRILNLD